MKITLNYLMVGLLLLLICVDKPTMAQSVNMDNDVVSRFSSAFFKKKIHYTEIPQDVFTQILVEKKDKFVQFESKVSAGYFRESGGVVEVKSGNDIYTWPIALSSSKKDIVFYAQGVNPKDRNYEVVVHGMHVSIALANLNMVKIGERTASVFSCFDEPNVNKAELVIPEQFVVIPEKNENNLLLLSYTLTYSEVASVFYTKPKYTVVAGQLFEVNDGVNYDVQMYDVAGLSLFDIRTMKAVPNTTIHLKRVDKPRLKYSKSNIYYYNLSNYRCRYQDGSRMKDGSIDVMSQSGTPIYILNVDQSQIIVESQINPEDGDVVCDLQETSKYICYCGTNKKHGYVGYENPVLVVIDKDSKRAVARYNGNHGEGRKDRFFDKMYVLDDDHLLMMYNDYSGDSFMSNIRYEIVSISSIVSDFIIEGAPCIYTDEEELMEYDEESEYHIDYDSFGN